MRGKRESFLLPFPSWRITPAHAGKTKILWSPCLHTADHPRTCGENESLNSFLNNSYGSPPHMRGKPCFHPLLCSHFRITPAHAGKTFFHAKKQPLLTDHPRTCGENVLHPVTPPLPFGSPPHMRGKPAHYDRKRIYERITPAHAGKTFKESDSHRGRADHPRTCGENSVVSVAISATPGSPPHMRGKHDE